LGSPTELKPTETPAAPLTPGEAEIFGDPIRVTVDGLLRGLFTFDVDGRLIDYGSVLFPDDDLAVGAWKIFSVPRKLIRVPPMIRGMKV